MDQPVCLSQSFVNKQNVRSFGNIIQARLLKNENGDDFLLHILQEKDVVSQVTQELCELLFKLRDNLEDKCKQDFRNYFPTEKSTGFLEPVNKEMIFTGCWSALYEIIPKEFYGNNSNIKVLKKFVNTVIFSMRGEHVILSNLLGTWNFLESPWKYIPQGNSLNILYKILMWINKNIVSSTICLNFYVTTTKLSFDKYKLFYFWKNEWHSFYDKEVSKMIRGDIMRRDYQNSFGRKTRALFSLSERLQKKVMKKSIPKLYLILKGSSDYRPIVRYKNEQISNAEKNKIKGRLNLLKILTGNQIIRMESTYYSLHQTWLKAGLPKLYFVKTDLTNAFGSIDKQLLMKILAEKHATFQKTEKNLILKRNMAAIYKDFVTELKKPFLIRAGSTIYIWNKGLVQGYRYSPALSELYYSYLDAKFLKLFVERLYAKTIFLTRVVDDYFFVTDSMKLATEFLNTLSNYNNVNYNKTVVNFDHPKIQKSTEITFLGYSYNTTNLQVSHANNVFSGQMCYKIAFSPAIHNIYKFLENRIGQSGIQINGHLFNFHHNSEDFVWKHTFTTLCLSANKFCTILAILSEEREMEQYLGFYKRKVAVKLCNYIIETLLRNKADGVIFRYCINHFRYLAWKALWHCARKTPRCNKLVASIADEMAKCNCLFGKWREHARVMTEEGVPSDAAVKEVCRRTDLRVIVRSFNEPPPEFKFYNNRCRFC